MSEVVRTGLDKHIRIALAPASDLIQRHAGADVGEIDGGAEVLGEVHGAQAGFRLSDTRLDGRPVAEGVHGALQGALTEEIDELYVLRMNDDRETTYLGGALQKSEEIGVVGTIEAEISAFIALEVHEIFEGADAVFLNVPLELFQVRRRGRAEMKTKVDVRALLGERQLPLEHSSVGSVVKQVTHNGRETTVCGVCGFRRILRNRLGEAEMNMRVDESGKQISRRSVNDASRLYGCAGREEGADSAVLRCNFETGCSGRGYYGCPATTMS